ncbi:hypothetical protein IFO69_21385 [Echinicola sp. CAU 1574]|uniref:Uncharacterized protein n=1 Tax=Echinicola arenosa TaxID=2774144 RepID=A0ABR9ARJ3_9BACT|nr:hypothetical protein [Echinicola arenosa]MBD8491320.1 hypothetical protein [Echinicola arenosa]
MRILLSVLILLLALNTSLLAQTPKELSWPQEKVSVHISKNIAVVGESVPLSVKIRMEGQPSPSQFAYVDLISRNGERVSGSIIPLTKGAANAYVQVPENIPTDHYLLRLYTRLAASLADDSQYHHELITVINPEIPPAQIPKPSNSQWVPNKSTSTIKIHKNKEQLIREELGEIMIEASPDQELTVSISKKNPFLEAIVFTGQISSKKDSSQIIPELRGHIVKGQLITDKIDTKRPYLLSVHGDQSSLYLGKPNNQGEVYFDLGALKSYNFMILQSDADSIPFSMDLQEPFAPSPKGDLLLFPAVNISEENKEMLDDLVLSYSTTDYFYAPQKAPTIPIVTGFDADRAYNLDEYNRFESLATTLKEYIPTVLVRKEKGEFHFKLSNFPEDNVFQNNPLMLIDGMPVFDSDAIGNFSPDNIKRIEVINRKFFILDNAFEGVLNFTSYENDFGGFPIPKNALYLEYPKIQNPMIWNFNGPESNSSQRLPDFRTIFYWDDTVKTDSNGKAKINFKTSEISGKYEIKVSYTNPSGELIQTVSSFMVKDTK